MNRAALLVASSLVASLTLVAVAQPAPTAPARPANSADDGARRSKVVVKLKNRTITVGDVEDEINAQSPFLRARFRDPARLREFVDNMIRVELLGRAAESRGFARNEEVERTVDQSAVQQLIRVEFDERLTAESIPEADVRAYYDGHPEEFNRPEMVRASHILVASRDEAVALIAQARTADARAFRDLAREKSVDTETKLRGGDLRYFARTPVAGSADPQVDSAIVAAAFSLREVGDVVREPVQVGSAWSVIKLTGRRPAEHRSIEEAGPGIRLRLWRERRQQAIDRFVEDLRQRHAPIIEAERLGWIQLDPLPAERTPGGGGPTAPSKVSPTKRGESAAPAPSAPILPPGLGGHSHGDENEEDEAH